ncbi:MAG: site-specific integrase [Candidatus Acidiferrum sp.]|jgi:integrase
MQHGCMQLISRKRGPDTWQFRWSETTHDGRRFHRKKIVGSVEQYPEENAARRAVVGLISEINTDGRLTNSIAMTVGQLCDHFAQRELSRENAWRSHATKKIYQAYLNRWIRPHWEKYELGDVRTIQVESWLRALPLAKSSCAKIRNLMSVLFNHACRYELFDRNPIYLVRQSAKRRAAPVVLTPAEIKMLVSSLAIRERTLVLLAASTGLRQSELFGLRWGDIDFSCGTMSVTRSIVYGVVGPCKTESSQKPVPIHPMLADALMQWRKRSAYIKSDDWVFASKRYRGRRPYWGQAILRKYIRPAAQRVGIQKRFGWHTFRHSYSTLLRSVGTEFKVMQELLRHSSLRSTLDVYTQAVTPAKHAAQAAVLSLVFASNVNGGACSSDSDR